MGISRMFEENMGTPKQEAQEHERLIAASQTKLGGEGIERTIQLKERTLSNFEANNMESRARGFEAQAGTSEMSYHVTGDQARKYQQYLESQEMGG